MPAARRRSSEPFCPRKKGNSYQSFRSAVEADRINARDPRRLKESWDTATSARWIKDFRIIDESAPGIVNAGAEIVAEALFTLSWREW